MATSTQPKAVPAAPGEEGILVAIRMRPLNNKEKSSSPTKAPPGGETPHTQRVWRVLPAYNSVTQTLADGQPLKERVNGRTFFQFDKAFGEAASTPDVYAAAAKGIVESVTAGLNGTIFAYGQTSSGKTFTMQGSAPTPNPDTPGIVHMAARDIFDAIATTTGRDFLVRVSFIEIYNEEVRDLLVSVSKEQQKQLAQPGGSEASSGAVLQIREDPKKGVYVDAKENIVTNFEGLMNTLMFGEKNRSIGSTAMNERSSRSHTIFRVTVESKERKEGDDNDENTDPDNADKEVDVASNTMCRVSTLNLVDLAGSESVRLTGASGERQKEGGKINMSLLTLSRVIHSLGQAAADKSVHVNYRDSKLTRILQPSLAGNARMAIICCATPSELYLEETRSTLQFAARAKLVKTRAQVNEVLDDRAVIKKLQKELADLRILAGGGKAIKHLRTLERERDDEASRAEDLERKLKQLKDSIIRGGALYDPIGNISATDKASKLAKLRRMTVAPKSGSSISSLLDEDDDLPPAAPSFSKKDFDLRRKSLGTALLLRKKAEPSMLGSGADSVHDDGNSRRLSSGSTDSDSSFSSAKSASNAPYIMPSSELSLLRQALATKGEQSRNLKAQLQQAALEKESVICEKNAAFAEKDALAAEKAAIEMERDEIANECEELIKQQEALQLQTDSLLADKEELVAEKELECLEKQQAIAERDEIAQEKLSLSSALSKSSEEIVSLNESLADLRKASECLAAELEEAKTLREIGAAAFAEEKEALRLSMETQQKALKDEIEKLTVELETRSVAFTEKEEQFTLEMLEREEVLRKELSEVVEKFSAAERLIEQNATEFSKERSALESAMRDKETNLNDRINELVADLAEANLALQTRATERSALESAMRDKETNLNARIDELVADLSEAKTALETRANVSVEEATAKAAAFADLEHKHKCLEQTLLSARNDNDDLMEGFKEERAFFAENIATLENNNLALAEQFEQQKQLSVELAHKKEEEQNAELLSKDAELAASRAEVLELQKLLRSCNEVIDDSRKSALDSEKELKHAREELADALAMAEEYKINAENARDAANAASADEALLREIENLEAKLEEAAQEKKKYENEMRQLLKEEARSLALEADVSMKKLKDELKSVKFELEKAEADTSDARRRNQDLKDQCEAAEADAYEVRQTVEDLTEQCEAAKLAAGAARNAADEANKAAFEANKQVKLLKAELVTAAKSGSAGSAEKVKKLEEELESKEARIKKLEAVRLTKEQCAALKKMKEERLQYMSEVKALKSQNESLKKSIAAGSQDFSVHEANSAEIRALKDANETLSEKLRKYAAHCQRLEGEKVAAAASLQSSECADAVSLLAAGDFSGSVAAMCERLGAAEEECAALASAETRANAYLTQLDRAKEEGARLEQEKAVAMERVARLMKLEQERAEQLNDAEDRVATLLQEKQELLAKNNSAVSKNVEVESEKARQVRFLEQENLQLMMEAKNVKKKLQTVQAEFDAFRMASKEMRSPLRGLDRNGGGTPTKNNSGTPTKSSMSAAKHAGTGTSTKKVGLGERAEDENFDATSECKQS